MTIPITNRKILEILAKEDISYRKAARVLGVNDKFITHRMQCLYYHLNVHSLAAAVYKVFVEGRPSEYEYKVLTKKQIAERGNINGRPLRDKNSIPEDVWNSGQMLQVRRLITPMKKGG